MTNDTMRSEFPLVYRWGNNPLRQSRKGQRCRVVVRSRRMRSVLVEFEDGFRMVTSARAVSRASGGGG